MQFDFNVGPNQSQHIDAVGTFIKYKAGAGTIRVRLNGGGYIDLLPGQGVNNVKFTSIDVQDRTGSQNSGTILAGIYDFRDDRITGTVDVVDGGRTRTFNNQAFSQGAGMNGSAGQYPYVFLFNPAGSGKNVIIESIVVSSNAVGGWGLSWTANDPAVGSAPGRSKKAGGANSAAYLKVLSDPTLIGTGYFTLDLQASQPFVHVPKEPYLLVPGTGLAVRGSISGGNINSTFEWFEESI